MESKDNSCCYRIPAKPVKFVFELLLFFVVLAPLIAWAGIKKIILDKRKKVDGQVVLITGTARGLGRGLALEFHKLGAKIACVDVEETGNNETTQLITDRNGIAKSYKVDVSDREQIKAMHEFVQRDLGPVDILINNAGIVWGHSYFDPEIDQMIINLVNVNFLAQFWMNREILPSMLKRNSGHVVAISSLSSMFPIPASATYSATKCAVNASMEALRKELDALNSAIVTTTVCPYFVKTSPDNSKRLNIRFPEIPVNIACKIIVNGILENLSIFSVPRHMYYIITVLRLLPSNVNRLFNKICYTEYNPEVKN